MPGEQQANIRAACNMYERVCVCGAAGDEETSVFDTCQTQFDAAPVCMENQPPARMCEFTAHIWHLQACHGSLRVCHVARKQLLIIQDNV